METLGKFPWGTCCCSSPMTAVPSNMNLKKEYHQKIGCCEGITAAAFGYRMTRVFVGGGDGRGSPSSSKHERRIWIPQNPLLLAK